MGEYRAHPAGPVGVEKVLNDDGHTVGYIEEVVSDGGAVWLAILGPGNGDPQSFPDYESALRAITTHADEHPDFRIDE